MATMFSFLLMISLLLLLLQVFDHGKFLVVAFTTPPCSRSHSRKAAAAAASNHRHHPAEKSEDHSNNMNCDDDDRRSFFKAAAASGAAIFGGFASGGTVIPSSSSSVLPGVGVASAAATGAAAMMDAGNLSDLPSEAARSYLQYRIPLKISADYYLFSLKGMIGDVDQWGEVGQLFRVNNNKGQGQPSKIERDYVNTMRIILLSFPPDVSEDMRDAQFKFEKAMNAISKATAGYRRDLPVEIDKSSIETAVKSWDDGRIALNEFFLLLNTAVGLNELTYIPPNGPNQIKEYKRSPSKYNELQKKIKLCQNRGGPALSQAWGQLMVSGYLQDSCGIPDLNVYFNQEL